MDLLEINMNIFERVKKLNFPIGSMKFVLIGLKN